MRSTDRLVTVGLSAAKALRSQESWIHRRVESLTFPLPEQPVYRRQVSIDFTIPEGLKPAADPVGGRPARYYVPLSLIRKWPPLPSLDLRGSSGEPIPFLTAAQNQLLDAAALLSLAVETVTQPIPNESMTAIARIARTRGNVAAEAVKEILPSLQDAPRGTLDQWHEDLRADEIFRGLATAMARSTLLWFRVDGQVEDRAVVKFAYDIPYRNELEITDRATFGLRPFTFAFDTPHAGSSGSYHLNLTAPAPLEIAGSVMVLYEPQPENPAPDEISQLVRHEVSSSEDPPPGLDVELFAGVSARQAKFYVSGKRPDLTGRVHVYILVAQQGLLRGALGAAVGTAIVLVLVTALQSAAAKKTGEVVGLLLIAPAILGYLLVRPSEHVLAGGLLAGVRRLVISIGIWPVAAATVFALSAGKMTTVACIALIACCVAEVVTAALLGKALYCGDQWRRDLAAPPGNRLSE